MKRSMLILMLIFSVNIQLFSTNFELKNLKDSSNKADYLVISIPKYFSNIQPLLERRYNQNLNVKLIDVNIIDEQFKATSRAESIRNFLFYSFNNWKVPKPKYVLLVGWLETIPNLKINLMNTFEFDTLARDNNFVLDTNSGKMKIIMSIGRIPARSANDIDKYMGKINFFEDRNKDIYKNELVSITDSLDNELFESTANIFIDKYFSKSKTRIISGNSKNKEYGNTNDLINSANSGTNYLLGMIHGNMCRWGYNNILNCNMFDTLKFGQKPFIFIAVSCSQSFNDPNKRSLLEKLMFETDGGIIASIASEVIASFNSGVQLLYSYFDLSKSPNMKIGDAFKEAINLNINNPMLLNYSLLGDPYLSIPVNISDVENTPSNPDKIVISPNPASDYIEISSSTPFFKGGNGVSFEIYNIFGEITAPSNPSLALPEGAGTRKIDISNLAPGVYFIRIGSKFEKFIKI